MVDRVLHGLYALAISAMIALLCLFAFGFGWAMGLEATGETNDAQLTAALELVQVPGWVFSATAIAATTLGVSMAGIIVVSYRDGTFDDVIQTAKQNFRESAE